MSDRREISKRGGSGSSGRARVLGKVAEVARREAGLVLPAARRAAGHGIEAFLKKFSEEYAKERRRKR
jgi:hypothetical protein